MSASITLGKGRRRIYLMRHAEAAYVREDGTRAPDSRVVPLTARGREQAAAARDALREIQFDVAFCSNLPRTRETAEIVVEGRDQAVEAVHELEEVRPGDVHDLTAVGLAQDFIQAMARADEPDARFLGGERFVDLELRVIAGLERILSRPDWTRALVVAHGGVNRVLLGWASEAGRKAFPAFEQDTACINVIDVDMDDGIVVRKMIRMANLAPYNPVKQGSMLTTMEGLWRSLEKSRA